MILPADVPHNKHSIFKENFDAITCASGKMLLFAGDHAIEHLQEDFYGSHVHHDAHSIEHLFNIASSGYVDAFATQLGLIARYGTHYKTINYIAKLNSKSPLVSQELQDPLSEQLWSVEDALAVAHNGGLALRGIGYTIYLGSMYEHIMLKQAAQAITAAHRNGLVAILWMYPRGTSIPSPRDGNLIAGAAGVGAALGADFVKIYMPDATHSHDNFAFLAKAQKAAGTTGVLLSGGKPMSDTDVLTISTKACKTGIAGLAVGRNIFQRSYDDACALAKKLHAIVHGQ